MSMDSKNDLTKDFSILYTSEDRRHRVHKRVSFSKMWTYPFLSKEAGWENLSKYLEYFRGPWIGTVEIFFSRLVNLLVSEKHGGYSKTLESYIYFYTDLRKI